MFCILLVSNSPTLFGSSLCGVSIPTVEWSTSIDVSLLLADSASDNVAAFCSQDGSTDRKSPVSSTDHPDLPYSTYVSLHKTERVELLNVNSSDGLGHLV